MRHLGSKTCEAAGLSQPSFLRSALLRFGRALLRRTSNKPNQIPQIRAKECVESKFRPAHVSLFEFARRLGNGRNLPRMRIERWRKRGMACVPRPAREGLIATRASCARTG